MPKRTARAGETALLRFHMVQNASLTAGVNNISMNPANISPRCLNEADAFEWYRIRSLKFRILALTTSAAVGFVEGKPDTIPANQAQVVELLDSVLHMGPVETCWSRWVNVPRTALAGALPWYKTIQGTATDEEELVGFLVVAGTGTNAFALEYYVEVEFKGPIATANTPAMVALRAKQREEARQVRLAARRALLLGYPPTAATPLSASLAAPQK